MKLLILTNYFTPDLSAGSFRMKALVSALEKYKQSGLEVDLITTMPSRYEKFNGKAKAFEDFGWLRIHRINLPNHSNSMFSQSRSYVSYIVGVLKIASNKDCDVVFATSSRLMTSVLGALISKIKHASLYLDIRDIFTDNLDELFRNSPFRILNKCFKLLERYSIKTAIKVNVVSPGFIEHIKYNNCKVEPSLFTNGVDDIFANHDFNIPDFKNKVPLIVYAGNFGAGQSLHNIIPRSAKLLKNKANFILIGDGGQREQLMKALKDSNVTNVKIIDPMPREELLSYYQMADILFLHLDNLKVFEKVLPSKIFEYGATGKPILAGVAGCAREFLNEHLNDAKVFNPRDADAMVQSANFLIDNIEFHKRTKFKKKFSRDKIMIDMAQDLLELMPCN